MTHETKQKMATFKRLQRRARAEKTSAYLKELAELDRFLVKNVPQWKATYSKYL